jgi:23S rRNA pseudouridine2457 synthase
LDADSEGLLLLTNDGLLQHRLTDPKFRHPRTYWAQVENIPDELALEKLRTGVQVKDYFTRPAQAKLLNPAPELPPREPPIRHRQSIPTAWLELTITEGKNRQVRRMTAAVGFPTLRLIRVAIGDLTLSDLVPGQWRELSTIERQQLPA